jgi:hypothetical protein
MDPNLVRVRKLLVATFLTGSAGTVAELLLIGHTEDSWQFVPIVLLGASLVALAACGASAHRMPVRLFRALMAGMLVSAGVGLGLHYRANAEFELEMYPDLAGWALVSKAVRGKSPPTLAPGAMALLALVGLAWSCCPAAVPLEPAPRLNNER